MCIWDLFYTTTYFGCPRQPSNVWAMLHNSNKKEEASLYKQWVLSYCKLIIVIIPKT